MSIISLQTATLKEQLAAAWQFLKTTFVNPAQRGARLMDLPWYLVIGPTQTGKTQLITQSQLAFIDAPHLNIHPTDESEIQHQCNWWFTRSMTFLDIPGDYLLPAAEANTLWPVFLNALKPYLKRKPPNGVILVLDTEALATLTKSEQKKEFRQLHDALFLLNQSLNAPCPLYLLPSKVDCLSGFTEFFADLGKEEREQICGVNIAHAPKALNASLPRLFKNQFEVFIKRLHDRVIWRLHHERNAVRRALIMQFPLQLESLQAPLADFLYQLNDLLHLSAKLPLQGIYFVSSLQQGMPLDCLRKAPQLDYRLPESVSAFPLRAKRQTYFSGQLLQTIKANTATLTQPLERFSPQDKWRLGGYILAVTFIASSGLLMANHFNQRITQLNAAQTALAQYSVLEQQLPPENPDLGQTLPVLNTLRQATQLIHQTDFIGFSAQARHLTPLADTTYHASLNQYFLPDLRNMLEHALSNSTDADFTYGALKVYLMLGQPNRLDAPFVKYWFAHYWRDLFAHNLQLQQQLNNHLADLLERPFNPVELNQTIISKTRNLLANMAAPQLAYALVKSQYNSDPIDLINANAEQAKIFQSIFTSNALNVNSLYTSKVFADIYLNQTLTASAALLRGDWVLGATANVHVNNANLAALVQQVRLLYLKDYAQQWQNLAANVQLKPWQNLEEAIAAIDNIVKQQSALLHIIKAVHTNTDLTQLTRSSTQFTAADLQLINTHLSAAFAPLNAYMQNADGAHASGLDQTIQTLKQLQDLLKAAAKDEAAFALAKARFTHSTANDVFKQLNQLAANAPAPINQWSKTMAVNSWQLILYSSANYLNKEWQNQIIGFYQQQLKNHYPLAKNADKEISFADFKHFFGNNGLMAQFFNDYLTPFLDASHAQWRWRSLDGQTLPLADNVLPQLERAAIIRTMFFNKNDEFHVPFTLKALAFEPDIARFTFKLGKNSFSDQFNDSAIHALMWPAKGNDQSVTLAFTDNQEHTLSTTLDSDWALFRLLDKSNLQAGQDTQRYQLTFDYNGNAVRYELNAGQLINPFISGVLEAFQCPVTLLK